MMALPQIISRNAVQVIIPNLQLDITNVTIGDDADTLYTVPTGFVTEIISLAWRAQMGANTQVDLFVSGQRIRRTGVNEPSLTDEPAVKGFIMNAGETIQGLGTNAADNGTINLIASLKERAT